jgi:hypothetical protein
MSSGERKINKKFMPLVKEVYSGLLKNGEM